MEIIIIFHIFQELQPLISSNSVNLVSATPPTPLDGSLQNFVHMLVHNEICMKGANCGFSSFSRVMVPDHFEFCKSRLVYHFHSINAMNFIFHTNNHFCQGKCHIYKSVTYCQGHRGCKGYFLVWAITFIPLMLSTLYFTHMISTIGASVEYTI